MNRLLLIVVMLAAAGCATDMPNMPDGAAAWCGSIDYTGTWTKSESFARAIGVTDSELAASMTTEEIIQLAEALGCSQEG